MNFRSFDIEKILDIIIAFNTEKDYFEMLNIILNKMMEMTNADAGTLYVIEDNKLYFRITRNITLNTFQGAEDKIDLPPIVLDKNNIQNVSAYAAITNETVSFDDVYEENEKFNFSGPRNYDKITGYRTKSMLVFPLVSISPDQTQAVIGVIQLINAIDEKTGEIISFDEVCDRQVLLAISKIAANTLANIMFSKEIFELVDSFVRVMTTAIDERSAYNTNHTKNVARLCDAFCGYLGERFPAGHKYHFDIRRRDQIVMAALLHDIGKIITPLSIMDKADRLGGQLEIVRQKFEIKKYQLEAAYARNELDVKRYRELMGELEEALKIVEEVNPAGFHQDDKIEKIKSLAHLTYVDRNGQNAPLLTEANITSLSTKKGTLTDEERLIMQEHVSITGRLLGSMKFNKYYADVPQWASSHHEFLDGTGYPNKLKGELVTTEMSILTILDIFDALVASDRPYKRPMPREKAFAILREMADAGKLSNSLVELFIESDVHQML